jgi:hypothetical protein
LVPGRKKTVHEEGMNLDLDNNHINNSEVKKDSQIHFDTIALIVPTFLALVAIFFHTSLNQPFILRLSVQAEKDP